MKTIVFLLLGLISVALGQSGDVGSFENPFVLRGEFSDAQKAACPSGNCNNVEMTGPNLYIWHADGTCSILWLHCNDNHFEVMLSSPGNVTETYLTWMGAYPLASPFVSRPSTCTSSRLGSVIIPHRRTHATAAFAGPGSCDTRVVSRAYEDTMTNVLNILEFLEDSSTPAPAVQLLTHTHVEVQCCHSIKPIPSVCDEPFELPPLMPISNCTELSFDLVCSVNPITEFYECKLRLKQDETLGDSRLDYVVNSCKAFTAVNAAVPLITSSSPNSGLDVGYCVRGSGSSAVHEFEAPYFQFSDAAPCNIHDIQIQCEVSVVLASSPRTPVKTCYP